MMNLVVDGVEEQVVDAPWILTKSGHRLTESLSRDLRPQVVDRRRVIVPQPQQFVFGRRARGCPLLPLTGYDATDHRLADRDQLEAHGSEGPHPTDREAEELILGERLNHPPSQSAMPLP